ncbi:MAG: glycosyltransferase [Gallionella sp.]|nr:glycosyltransferase [Gallionella sp.]
MKKHNNSLISLFAEHRGKVTDKWSVYLAEYDRLFHAYRDRPVRLLEIGIQNGGSLEIWSKFFSKAEKLVGCDINPDCAQLQFDDSKIAVVVANANTDEAQQIILAHSPDFDLIIDDGSHQSGDIVRSFSRYFTYLNDGGLYVAEDLHCSYWQDFEGGIFQPYSSIAFFKRLADTINHEHWGVDKTRCELLRSFNRKYNTRLDEITLAHVHSIEFINSMCVIRKAKPTDNILGHRFVAGTNALVWEGALQLQGSSCPQPNQSENQWSTRDAPVEEELMVRIQEIANLNQAASDRDGEIIKLIRDVLAQDQNVFQKTFDAEWYVKKYPDIDKPGIDPYQHYIHYGVTEGRHPSADLTTFIRHGLIDRLKELNAQINQANQSNNLHDGEITDLIKALLKQDLNVFQNTFDAEWYVKKYPDIDKPGIDPYQHYIHYGVVEGRIPSADIAIFIRHGLLNCLKELNAQINQAKLLTEAQQLQYTAREHALLAQLALARQQIEAQSLELAQREKTYAHQLCAKQDEFHNLIQHMSEKEKAQAQALARLHIGLKAMSATLLSTPLNTNNRIDDVPLGHTSTAAATLEELLSYHDERFIHSAYHTLLGRAPDPEGMRYYLERVRAGISKIEVLAQLRLCAEGKSREVKITGLNKAIHSHQRQKKSILGALLRLAGVKADKAAQNLRAIENKFHMVNFKLQQQISEMDRGFCRLEKLFQNQERTQEVINKQIALSQKSQNVSLGSSSLAGGAIKVTVIILTKNPGTIFKDVLLAALSQETPWLYEVLVVDSGSSDGTIDFVRQHPRVRLLEVKSSEFGHGRTRNYAVSMAKGQYAAMLTHDAKPLNSNWLYNLVRPLDDDASVAGVFGRHKAYPDHTPYIKRDMEMHFNGFLQWPAVMGIEDPERYARDQGYRQVLHFFSDNNACLRKEVWKRIPYPDVNFAEDQLWAKAIIEAGYKRAYADDAVVYHSHDYSIKDTFRRSFDESRALKSLFGYDLCPSASHGFTQIYACAKSDLKFLSGSTGLGNSFGLAFRTPLLHIAKQSGWYIGSYQGRLKGILFWLFSLDGAKKRKTNMTFTNKWKSLFSSNERDTNQPQITEPTQQAAVVNKTDVIGFYDFVITEDAGTLPADSDAFDDMSINWLIPDFGIGSGGHLNIFRFIGMLEKKGYKNTICVVGSHRHSSPYQARAMISEHFFALQADVVFGVENLPAARYSFATSWITAYALKGFGATHHKLYFVQDFEPAFYAHGSEYDFAEATYKFGFTGVCSGDWLSRTLESDYGMKCHSISFSYDRALYQQTLRREPQKHRVFCYCRPPTIRRGWESAMLALSLVGQELPDVEFIFAGWDMGNYHFPYPHLNAGVCSLKELPDLYSQCDAALVFSFTNLSLLPLELMACGCVVVSNRAPNTEWLLNDNNSILPASSSPRAIAYAIVNILGDPKRRVELADRAKVFASSTSWEVEGERLMKILSDLDK